MTSFKMRKMLVAGWACLCTASVFAAPVLLHVVKGGSSSLPVSAPGASVAGIQPDELDFTVNVDGTDLSGSRGKSGLPSSSGGRMINRSLAVGEGRLKDEKDGKEKTVDNPELLTSFDGINLRDQRLANGGNQFTVEPPDQALCVGNGYVLESVNDSLRVFDTTGNPLTQVIDLNSFYHYPAAINRTTGKFGPSITDPVCLFDQASQRWFHVVLTLDRKGTTSALSGGNHLDIAVSTTASPLDSWILYSLPVQNNGTAGTPDHKCDGGFCLGDYPHIGADANGIYLTTNEFSLFGSGFYGAQIYALSKRALVQGAGKVPVVLINTGDAAIPFPGFTVWPAQGNSKRNGDDAEDGDGQAGNTEYLMSSLAVFENTNTSNQILLWSLGNTKSINEPVPALQLKIDPITTDVYGVPPPATQKIGSTPLRDCIADKLHDGCNAALGVAVTANNEYAIDTSDSRMQQVFLANGKLWASLATSVNVKGDPVTRTGIAYYVVDPKNAALVSQGTIAMARNNALYPAIAVTESGKGIVGFTLVGEDHYPSAAYAAVSARDGAGSIHIARLGAGPADGFSGYLPFSKRPRWGDYGAAATDGSSIWIASEYIAQTCTQTQYEQAPFGSCNGTRTSLANWATRLTRLEP